MNLSAIVKPCPLKTYQQGNIFCQYNPNACEKFSITMFSSQFWQQQNAIVGSAQGRGTTWFIAPQAYSKQAEQWVLRHYYRGGLIGKFIKDSYFFQQWHKTRAAKEFTLLVKLHQLALPAPQAIAYKIERSGLTYRADILTKRIEHAKDLVAILSENTIDDALWQNIGKTIRQFHQKGIYHHDLNAHNILIDDNNKVWLIDFDQGEQRAVQQQWQQANLQRLLRSFIKEQHKLPQFHWQKNNWQMLLQGYEG